MKPPLMYVSKTQKNKYNEVCYLAEAVWLTLILFFLPQDEL